MDTANLRIIGTSHISKNSAKEVRDAVDSFKPDIICLELDRNRFYALKNNIPSNLGLNTIKRIGVKGWLFLVFGAWIEKKLGKMVGTKPGVEMLEGIRLAEKNKIEINLVDQNIEKTLKNFSKSITWKEKFNFVADIFKAPFNKKKYNIDLNNVPSEEIIEKLILEVKDRYPNVYRTLIHDRNIIISRNLAKILKNNPEKKVLAILGAGHKKEVLHLLDTRFERLGD